ncbi:murein L,D-transpeptidase catalytic domain-containing protein [Apibacter sp. HY039]|uniref:murein L,D-transpeptidase catalytic domain-containing protein n=1 Tax=Apibacter sp. HY039 TaxID=2501476 RepID=UPI000FEB78B4|nr:murein L,D-transpeptidase catalytic domain family protein [Apibacter sp. HY039]
MYRFVKILRLFIIVCIFGYIFSNFYKCKDIGAKTILKDVYSQNKDNYDDIKKKSKESYTFCKKNNFNQDFCILIDMKIPSGKNRMFVWDFKKDTIIRNALCAHGMGTGDLKSTEETPVFSNKDGSYCSSLGKYKLGVRSYSQWGINIHYKMHGLEPTNSNAYKRVIVLHSYTPVPDNEIAPKHLPMGWSLGCPVTSDPMMRYLDSKLKAQKRPTLLWIFY